MMVLRLLARSQLKQQNIKVVTCPGYPHLYLFLIRTEIHKCISFSSNLDGFVFQ